MYTVDLCKELIDMNYRVVLRSLVGGILLTGMWTGVYAIDSDVAVPDMIHHDWRNTTDIGVKVQGGHNGYNYHHIEGHPADPIRGIPGVADQNLDSKENDVRKTQLYIETLQPITKDSHTKKSLVFVQGRISTHGGEKLRSNVYYGGFHQSPSYIESIHTIKSESIGTTGTIGVGYRRLSKHEHSYIGMNAFYDHTFRNGHKRASLGFEYVSGENEISANVYKGISGDRYESSITYHNDMIVRGSGYTDPYIVEDRLYDRTHVADGYDIQYRRTFKNARWANPYVKLYHWNVNHYKGVQNLGSPNFMYYYNTHGYKDITGVQVGAQLQLTPHISLDVGYDDSNWRSGNPYVQVAYTIGKKPFALWGGKHSDDTMTTARYKMFDKVERQDMFLDSYYERDYLELARNQL